MYANDMGKQLSRYKEYGCFVKNTQTENYDLLAVDTDKQRACECALDSTEDYFSGRYDEADYIVRERYITVLATDWE